MHGIAYDPVHDEVVVPNPLADAVLIFRAGASGDAAPLRVIQGPHTGLVYPHAVALDVKHDEILVGGPASGISVFPHDAGGDVAPLRVIRGPKARFRYLVGMAVDPVTDLLVVSNLDGVKIFNRTDNGDVAPRAIIAGPKTGLGPEPWQVYVYEGKIYVASSNHIAPNVYRGLQVLPGATKAPEDPWQDPDIGFVGVWNITDNGDVPPLAIIKGPFSGLLHPVGMAINPRNGEIYVSDSVRNGLFTFLVPDFFQHGERRTAQGPALRLPH